MANQEVERDDTFESKAHYIAEVANFMMEADAQEPRYIVGRYLDDVGMDWYDVALMLATLRSDYPAILRAGLDAAEGDLVPVVSTIGETASFTTLGLVVQFNQRDTLPDEYKPHTSACPGCRALIERAKEINGNPPVRITNGIEL